MSGHRTARALIYTHRWLGVALGLLFVVWFASGIVMIYARMPELSATERLARLPALHPSTIRAAPPSEGEIARLVISSLESRPIYRLSVNGRTHTIFADTGDPVPAVDHDQALRIARAFHGGTHALRYDARLTDADQWSFGIRARMPVHRIAVDDPQSTVLYVAEHGGDVLLKTTGSGRFWGWTGAVLHWWYFTPLRRSSSLWSSAIVWSSIAGTVMCIAGLLWGAWRYSPLRGYRLKRQRRWSPYAGWMRWHHYAGLLFGLTATTWIFSGLLSMDPWSWHPSTAPTREQRQRVSDGPIAASTLTVARLRRVIQAYAPQWPKEVEIVRFRGREYASASGGLVSFEQPQFGALDQLPPDALVGAASLAMPGVAIDGMTWLDDYDAYYYDRHRRLSLPVLRVRYADPQRTWLYFDPRRGSIARKEERLTRLNRWLYHGLHSLDFPFLYYRRPLWDVVVIALSLGGLVLSATTLTASWRRIKRSTARRLRR
ncbi:MAG TPA: PepSY domain-containing protein [Vicinamibacterales bacterium]|nr:PepSY domain-containing protein [Vicinamibacterales bacterium]